MLFMHLGHRLWYRCLGFLIVLVLWFVSADSMHLVDSSLLPNLIEVWHAIVSDVVSGEVANYVLPTMYRWIPGLIYGATLGTVFGLILGLNPILANVVKGPLEFLRAIPVSALIPLIFLLFNTGDESKIFMCFLPSFLLLVVYSESGVKRISKARVEVFQVMGASKSQKFFKLVLWETLPTTLLGLRLAFSTSLLVAIVSEMFMGANFGIGQRIYESYMYNNTIQLYALITIVGILGYLGSSFLESLETTYNKRILGCWN